MEFKEEKLSKLIIKYAIPMIFNYLVYALYFFVDGLFIGKYVGKEGLAAINILFPVLQLVIAIKFMIAVGTSTSVSVDLGKEKQKEANNTFNMVLCLLPVFGIISLLLAKGLGEAIYSVLGVQGSILNFSRIYLNIYAICIPLQFFSSYFGYIGRAKGKPKIVTLVYVSTTMLNVLLDYIFIAKLGYGVAGAVWATNIAYIVNGLLLTPLFVTDRIYFAKFRMNFKKVLKCLYNGIADFSSEISIGVTYLLYNYVIFKMLGDTGLAAMAILEYVGTIIILVIYAISTAANPIISYNYGAKEVLRVKEARKIVTNINIVIAAICAVIFIVFIDDLSMLFIKNDVDAKMVLSIIKLATIYYAINFIFMAYNLVAISYNTALEKPKIAATIAILRSVVLVAVGLFVLPYFMGDTGIWITILFADAGTTLIYLLFLKKKEKKYFELVEAS